MVDELSMMHHCAIYETANQLKAITNIVHTSVHYIL